MFTSYVSVHIQPLYLKETFALLIIAENRNMTHWVIFIIDIMKNTIIESNIQIKLLIVCLWLKWEVYTSYILYHYKCHIGGKNV
jgi:hypothetical protein